jgi:hypothetical protein
MGSPDGKMLKSYLNFLDNYGENEGNLFLQANNLRKKHSTQLRYQPQYLNSDKGFVDMENSVMGRFQRLQVSNLGHAPTENKTSGHSTSHPPELRTTQESIDTLASGEGSFELALEPLEGHDTDEQMDDAADGGVLGLLTKFYQQPERTDARL